MRNRDPTWRQQTVLQLLPGALINVNVAQKQIVLLPEQRYISSPMTYTCLTIDVPLHGF